MSKLTQLLNDKLCFSTGTKNFDQYLNNLSVKSVSILKDLNQVNYQLKNLNIFEFDEISNKYLNKLNDLYKDFMNKLKSANTDETLEVIDQLHISFANFFSFFNKNFQNYNDKHKNLIKLIPNGLKINFKLFDEVFVTENKTLLLKTSRSFCLYVIALINYFPTLMRTFETKLYTSFRIILTQLAFSNLIKDKKLLKLICTTFAMLIRLSPDISTKLNLFINKVIENIKYYNQLSTPKTIKTIKSQSKLKDLDENQNLFLFDENLAKLLKIPSLGFSINVNQILSTLLKATFKSLPTNTMIEINFSPIIALLVESIENYKTNSELISISDSDYIVEGLSLEDYKIHKGLNLIDNFKFLNFMIKNYNSYLYYYLPQIQNLTKSAVLNYESVFMNFFEVNKAVLHYFKVIIKYFDTVMLTNLNEIIFKLTVINFTEFYVAYLERKDKTVVKVDQSYFKLAKAKQVNIGNKKKGGMSLIQMAKSESQNCKLENYSTEDIEEILVHYFESKPLIKL